MTLRDLEIFCAVCETCNMTATAEKLHISQSSISQVIANIENEYGIRLFDRLAKKLYITESGRLLQDYAMQVLFSYHEMNDRLRGEGIVKNIYVGASATIGTYLLPSIMRRFLEIHPEIMLKIVVDNTGGIEDKILKNDLDLALVEGNLHSPHIVTSPFMDDELVLVCGRSHPLYKKDGIDKIQLSDYQFIVREEGSGTRELFGSVMNVHSISWEPMWVCNNTEGIKNAVINGIGLSVLSSMLIEKEVQNGDIHIIKIQGIEFKRKFNIIYHANKYLSAPIRHLIELVQNN